VPLKKILLKPGVNRENTRYTTEGGWYECDKIRFRQGNPETIGGWTPFTLNTFKGVCRTLWNWSSIDGTLLVGLGTNLKFYIEIGGAFNDITPIRQTDTLPLNPFTTDGTTSVLVNDPVHGAAGGTSSPSQASPAPFQTGSTRSPMSMRTTTASLWPPQSQREPLAALRLLRATS
jgi:hypothetical protein